MVPIVLMCVVMCRVHVHVPVRCMVLFVVLRKWKRIDGTMTCLSRSEAERKCLGAHCACRSVR